MHTRILERLFCLEVHQSGLQDIFSDLIFSLVVFGPSVAALYFPKSTQLILAS